MSIRPIPELLALSPGLVIFDKDGTLLDFHFMWGTWASELARRLEARLRYPVRGAILAALGLDPASGKVKPDGPLAVASIDEVYRVTREALSKEGVSPQKAQAVIEEVWFTPDPVTRARPLADLKLLFRTLREYSFKIAVATTDRRSSTLASLQALGLTSLLDALVTGDEGLPIKPAPDMVYALCRDTGVPPERSTVVGDTPADMAMGQSAGVGLLVGVLSGVGSSEDLASYGALLVPDVGALLVRRQG